MKTWKQSTFIGIIAILVFTFALVDCDNNNNGQNNPKCTCPDGTIHTDAPCGCKAVDFDCNCTYEPPHTHSFGTIWKSNTTQHWHECSCGEKSDIADHTWNWIVTTPATTEAEGLETETCTVCEATSGRTQPITQLHTHNFGIVWESNNTQHWHECSCGDKADIADHIWGNWTVKKEATITETGEANRSCNTCDRINTFIIPESTLFDSRDGQIYKIVQIGDQIWMAENLNYNIEGSKCYLDNPANGDIYGRLYNWDMAMEAGPSGWHLPSYDEWYKLWLYVILTDNENLDGAAIRLKATSGWRTYPDSVEGTDDFGFSALPGGEWDVLYANIGEYGIWWSSTEDGVTSYGGNLAKTFVLNNESIDPYFVSGDVIIMYSARYVKDMTNALPTAQ